MSELVNAAMRMTPLQYAIGAAIAYLICAALVAWELRKEEGPDPLWLVPPVLAAVWPLVPPVLAVFGLVWVALRINAAVIRAIGKLL